MTFDRAAEWHLYGVCVVSVHSDEAEGGLHVFDDALDGIRRLSESQPWIE